jgi:hypothetical protein
MHKVYINWRGKSIENIGIKDRVKLSFTPKLMASSAPLRPLDANVFFLKFLFF